GVSCVAQRVSRCSFGFFFSTSPLPSGRSLFPYTTLFRSGVRHRRVVGQASLFDHAVRHVDAEAVDAAVEPEAQDAAELLAHLFRSEEHTSELQSRENLVCRLLLEKKNKLKYFVKSLP